MTNEQHRAWDRIEAKYRNYPRFMRLRNKLWWFWFGLKLKGRGLFR